MAPKSLNQKRISNQTSNVQYNCWMIIVVFLLIFTITPPSDCCSSFLVTRGASVDGSAYLASTCDAKSSGFYFSPATDWPPGTKIMGKIPQVNHTFNVVHLVNEKSVSITETSWIYTRPELQHQHGAILFYGILIDIVLQRSSTAREAIYNIGDLLDKWGWSAACGETFSIADKEEVWIMDIVGKGDFEQPKLGAVFVARRVPNGYISAHANQARIQKFPLDNPQECIYHKDTIQFARDRGWYEGTDVDFDFTAAYSPISFEGARWSDARVWSIFNNLTTGMDEYLSYAQGKDLSNRLPLWVKPTTKLNTKRVFESLRDHFEGTWFDMLSDFDVGNQPFKSGVRFGPRLWKSSQGKQYIFERPISIPYGDFTVVSQIRDLPEGICAIEWFSFSDTSLNCYFPIYSTMKYIPSPLSKDHYDKFSFDSLFWMMKLVSNYAYLGYKFIQPVVSEKRDSLELAYIQEIKDDIDTKALKLFKEQGKDAAYTFTANYSVETVSIFMKHWTELFADIFTQFHDGQGMVYEQKWLDYIVEMTGDHFEYLGNEEMEGL